MGGAVVLAQVNGQFGQKQLGGRREEVDPLGDQALAVIGGDGRNQQDHDILRLVLNLADVLCHVGRRVQALRRRRHEDATLAEQFALQELVAILQEVRQRARAIEPSQGQGRVQDLPHIAVGAMGKFVQPCRVVRSI